MPTRGALSKDASCSQYTQATITTSVIGTQCCLRFFVGAKSQTEWEFPGLKEVDNTEAGALKFPALRDGADIVAKAGLFTCSCNPPTGNTGTLQPTASTQLALVSMTEGSVLAMFMGGACYKDASFSQYTQTITTTSAIGTQCCLRFFIGASSQTEEKFPVLDVYSTHVRASEKFPASQDGSDFVGKAGPHTCSCILYSGNTGLSSDIQKIQLGGTLCSCKACQQHNQLSAQAKVVSSKVPHICPVCKKVCPEKYQLDRHMRVHSGKRPYVCSICQKSFSRRGELVKHERVHSGERPYVCSVCQKGFTQKANLVVHERRHSGKKPSVCSTCERSFARRCDLIIHERVHSGERPYICSICQRSFSHRSSLVAHERLHSGDKPYTCSTCGKSFTDRAGLAFHKRLHSGEKPYVCSICQKGFAQKANLVVHKRRHSGEKPFVCSICQKSFTRRGDLVIHEKVHSGERPYVCSICQKGFIQKTHLVAHERLHSGEKPYT